MSANTLYGQTIPFQPGVYSLGAGDRPILSSIYAKPYVTGGAVRMSWDTCEKTEGIYNWTFIDNEIQTAKNAGKKISLALGAGSHGTPAWVYNYSPQTFSYIDINPNHPTYLDTVTFCLPWDPIYLLKLTTFIQALGAHIGNDTTIAFIRDASGNITEGWGLANTDSHGNSWSTYGYTPDTLLYAYKKVLGSYMTAFPHTAEWVEVGNINFEPMVSGNTKIYVGEQMALYGFSTYPDRFNVWREDFSDCIPDPPAANSFWHILHDNPCHNGAQAIWNVQDGSTCHFRMNNCDNSATVCQKDTVLWRAIKRCLDYKMYYTEIYAADISDSSLSAVLTMANDSLQKICGPATSATVPPMSPMPPITITPATANVIGLYPNPFSDRTTLRTTVSFTNATLTVYNSFGQRVKQVENLSGQAVIFARDNLPNGMYLLSLSAAGKIITTKKILIGN